MRFVLVAGGTETADIDGISAAGADPVAAYHTPSADVELVEFGTLVEAPAVPVSPTGCPTPSLVTRSVRDLVGFETLIVDAGLRRPTGAPTVTVADEPGGDVRTPTPVPRAREIFDAARRLGASLPDEELFVGETIPGGTTTALAVLAALGERASVSSSLPENPMDLKRAVVDEGLRASDIAPGETGGAPVETLRRVGDPVLAAVSGLTVGALERGASVTLAGGTQLAAAAALVRHAGVDAPLSLATTSFVAADETAGIDALARDLGLELTVTSPGFEGRDHPAMAPYVAGEAKEGVGMGGALALAERDGHGMDAVRERLVTRYERAVGATAEGTQ